MPFVSELIGKPVLDCDGETVGTLNDLIAAQGHFPIPQIVAIEVKTSDTKSSIPIADVAALIPPAIALNKKKHELHSYPPGKDDIFLARSVMDKQIIDTNGVRVVRVNDLELSRVNDGVFVANVDVGGAGLMRRLGFGKLARQTSVKTMRGKLPAMISWEDVELLSGDEPLRLKVPGEKLAELHPADLAEILSDLTRNEGSKLLEALDDETLADTLEEVEPDFQASLVEDMSDERVADVLEEMSPDEAADLLAELPGDRSETLLNLMEKDEAEDVRRLLAYPVESAGGLMNTEFITVSPNATAGEVLTLLRASNTDAETMYYLYAIDEKERLVGVFSLRQLVLAPPRTKVKDFMEKRVVALDLLDEQERAAQLVAKYNLLALPVVDQEKHMHGIITADDALDKIIPTAWKKRLPRLYH